MEKIKVGDIINTHGIKGELKVSRTGIEEFNREIFYYIGESSEKFKITNSRFHKNNYIIKIEGYDNINDVLKFKNKSIYIDEADTMELKEDIFYIKDLIDVRVIDSNNKNIGYIDDVLEYDVNDVYVIKTDDNKEILVPAVKEFIVDIDLDRRIMKVNLLEGM